MAEVFKAKSFGVEGFEKVLVIKRILPELAQSPDFVDMFIHEAKLAVRLSHANIVQVFDLGKAQVENENAKDPATGDAYFMAMEYVNGVDLATLLARCRRQQVLFPIDLCIYVTAEVAKGLDHAHRRRDEQLKPLGIVHRDVSPQNVLVSLEGEVKVTDFGIAKARGALDKTNPDDTRTRKLQGKFGYMSPEQARGEDVDARTDIFSLGIVLYETLCGVNPFSAPTTFETLRRVQACEYPPAELLRPDIPKDLITILKTAMAKDAKERYPDAGRFYESLLAFLYSQGSRFGANELGEFVQKYAAVPQKEEAQSMRVQSLAEPAFETDGSHERTPVEVPPSRAVSSVSRVETGVRVVQIDRAAGMGERREVTALVVDLPRGASNETSERASQLVVRYGGRIYKREPEQICALFGLGTEPDGRDTEVAARCALVSLRSIEGPKPAAAGLHTARIHVSAQGEPTEDERLSGLIASARDLARAREGRAAVSGAAMRQLKGLFVFEPVTDAEHPHSAVSGSLIKDARGPLETFYGRFVGRKDELRRVGEVLAGATRRAARAFTIRGGHGIGKTRLLYEVERRLQRGGYNVGWYIASCPPRGREFPLSGIVCMLQNLCGTSDGDSHERVMAVQPRLRALGLHDEEVGAILTALGANVPAAPGANAKTALRRAFTRMVASLCEDKPYCFAWDGAHNVDEDSWAVLESAFQRLRNTRVVFAFTAREGFTHPIEKSQAHAALDLSDLKIEELPRLIGFRLSVDSVPDELVRFVRERAGGHPLFVEEVLKGLLDAGAVNVAQGKIVSMRLVGQELALPKTLRGLVASRVNRLSNEDRATLQAAAVLGDPIDSGVLSAMLGQPLSALERTLGTLKSRELLVQTGPSELRFASPIVREVVVDALPPEASREMHAAAGVALEQVTDGEESARIATHFYEAGDQERAATYFAKSAERRIEARQLEAAVRDYTRAIDLCHIADKPPAELLRWLEGLASAVRLVRSAPEALEMCERLVARIDQSEDRALRVKSRVAAARVLTALHKFEPAGPQLAEAEKIAEGDDVLLKQVLVAAAENVGRRGDFARALQFLERLQKLATEEGDKGEEHRILINLAQARASMGDRKAAFDALDRAERLIPQDLPAACERQKVRGLVHFFCNEFREGVAESEKAVDMGRALGLSYEVTVNLHNVGDALVRLNDFARAYGAFQQSLALCDECGYERLGNHNRMFLAYLAGLKGDPDAEKQLGQGIRYAEANDYIWDVINGRYLLADMHRRLGQHDVARAEFQHIRELALASGHTLVAQECDAALRALAS
jgi:serine/threonine protein kinase/tetratricopeptide (TPR) repeat protein